MSTSEALAVVEFLLDMGIRAMDRNSRLREFIRQAKQQGRDDITPEELENFTLSLEDTWDAHMPLVKKARENLDTEDA